MARVAIIVVLVLGICLCAFIAICIFAYLQWGIVVIG